MKRAMFVVAALAICLILVSCAAGPNQAAGTADGDGKVAGFWRGLWHGFIILFTFVISLFNDSVQVYEVHNRGNLYNLGFLLGIMAFFGGSGNRARRKSRRR